MNYYTLNGALVQYIVYALRELVLNNTNDNDDRVYYHIKEFDRLRGIVHFKNGKSFKITFEEI